MSDPMTPEQARYALAGTEVSVTYVNSDGMIDYADGNDLADAIGVAIAERDALRARIESAPVGIIVRAGDDDSGQPRVIVHSTREDLARGPNMIGKRVALVVIE